MNVIFDLLPWEGWFMSSAAATSGLGLLNLLRAARGKTVQPWRWLLMALGALAATAPWISVPRFGERLQRGSQTNIADTHENAPWLGLIPHRYSASIDDVGSATIAAFEHLGWTLSRRDETSLAADVPIGGGIFTDDLVVTLTQEQGLTVVHVRSAARVGRGDLGANRRHVVQLFSVLDTRLGGQRR